MKMSLKSKKEIDELFNQLVDKFDFDTTYSSLLHNGLGKYMPSHYLDEFTPPPELV